MTTGATARSLPPVPAAGGIVPAADETVRARTAAPGRSVIGAATKTLGRVALFTRTAAGLSTELAKVAVGVSDVAPNPRDRRFSDPTWTGNPAYHRLMQSYLATSDALTRLAEEVDLTDWHQRERARFLALTVTSALAPTNTLLGNPAALKRTFETGGANLVTGATNYLSDLAHNGGLPSQVDRSEFVVGKDVAVTKGAVIYRNQVLELLQYGAQTPTVQKIPVVIVPPQINKYYFMDLAPGRSLIEFATQQGLQVFAISWRNPGKEHGDWDLDTYGRAIIAALDAVQDVTGSSQVHVFGLCAGGITAATVLNHLAAIGDTRVRSASFGVTLLDWSTHGQIGMLNSKPLLRFAAWRSRTMGVMDGQSMASVFTWMRPNDLVWNYWVNNYLMGNKPAPFDILAWNADKTNLPGAVHGQFLDLFGTNAFAKPGAMTVLGSPVDLSRITADTYITGGTTDHLTPWRGCFRSAGLVGGNATFVLANTGHIQTLVCPPNNPKSRYWVGPEPGPDPDAWKAAAEERTGSWWEHWAKWVIARSDGTKRAPTRLGSNSYPALADAPGTYVLEQA